MAHQEREFAVGDYVYVVQQRESWVYRVGRVTETVRIPGVVLKDPTHEGRTWVRYQMDNPHPLSMDGYYAENFLTASLEHREPFPEELDL